MCKGFRDLCPSLFWDRGDTTHAQKGFLWLKTQKIMPGHNESCSSQKSSLQDPSWLRGECAPRGRSQGRSDVGKKPGNWPEGRQRPGRSSSSLKGSLTPFLCCASILNHFSMCCTTCCFSVSNNFIPSFTVSVSLINIFFNGGKYPGKSSF